MCVTVSKSSTTTPTSANATPPPPARAAAGPPADPVPGDWLLVMSCLPMTIPASNRQKGL